MSNDPNKKKDVNGFCSAIQAIFQKAQEICNSDQVISSAEQMEELEQKLGDLTDQLQAIIIEERLQSSLDSEAVRETEADLVANLPWKLKNKGLRDVVITLRCGVTIVVRVSYYVGKKKRKKRGSGLYPGLIILGINDHCTPGLASEIAMTVSAMDSFEEAQANLSQRGIFLNVKTIQNIVYKWAQRARLMQKAGSVVYDVSLKGRRVVISTDGGRVRIRKNKRGKKTNKGRNRYHTKWREPKLLIIYVTNEEGRREVTFAPFIDGIMRGPDALFGLLQHYLSRIGIAKADKILFVADGAKWIWDRVPALIKCLGLKIGQFYELLDFYHATEHLSKVASLRKNWNSKKRKQWFTRQRTLLRSGKTDQVIETIRALCRGRNSRAIRTQLDYFIKHRRRMDYTGISELGLPCGSGAIESAVRRVINLRIKGPGIFWKKESAEAILLLRSYYKAGRWNLLKQMAISSESIIST